jgi:hypothetical protein
VAGVPAGVFGRKQQLARPGMEYLSIAACEHVQRGLLRTVGLLAVVVGIETVVRRRNQTQITPTAFAREIDDAVDRRARNDGQRSISCCQLIAASAVAPRERFNWHDQCADSAVLSADLGGNFCASHAQGRSTLK